MSTEVTEWKSYMYFQSANTAAYVIYQDQKGMIPVLLCNKTVNCKQSPTLHYLKRRIFLTM